MMTEQQRGLLFDMDGVLVDTSESYDQTILKVVSHYKGEVALQDIYALRTKGGYNNDWMLTDHLLQESNIFVPFSELKECFQSIYLGEPMGQGLMAQERWLLEASLLQSLAQTMSLGIVTGRPRVEAQFTLRKAGVEEFFQVLVSMDDVTKQKPDPEGVRKAMADMKITQAIYLGDSVDDCRAAKAAGVGFLGVIPPRHEQPERLQAAFEDLGTKKILENVNQIVEVIHA